MIEVSGRRIHLGRWARVAVLAVTFLALPVLLAFAESMGKSDAEIKQELIKQSIAAYSGNCPCPYNAASNGSRCGGRSAYSRPGGASPLCFPDDVPQSAVDAWRKKNATTKP